MASTTGLALIGASIAFIGSATEFPGALMILPVGGACLVVLAPGHQLGTRLLSSRLAVWIGLISYPLYLWHWPLLSLLHNFERAPSSLTLALLVAVSVVLAALTRRLVERPLVAPRLRTVAASLAAAMLAQAGLTTAAYASTPIEARAMANDACTRRYPYRPAGLWSRLLSKDAAPTVLVLGDSHAHHLYEGLARALPTEAVLSIGACPPMIGLVFPDRADATGACFNAGFKTQSDYLNEHVVGAPSLKWVVVSAMWRSFDASGREIGYWSGAPVPATFGPIETTPLAAYVHALERQIDRLGPLPVTIVLDTPRRGLDVDLQRQRQAALRAEIAALAKRHANVSVFDPMPVLRSDHWCRWNELRDANHLSRRGSVDVPPRSSARRCRFGRLERVLRSTATQLARCTQLLRNSATAGPRGSTKVIDWISTGAALG